MLMHLFFFFFQYNCNFLKFLEEPKCSVAIKRRIYREKRQISDSLDRFQHLFTPTLSRREEPWPLAAYRVNHCHCDCLFYRGSFYVFPQQCCSEQNQSSHSVPWLCRWLWAVGGSICSLKTSPMSSTPVSANTTAHGRMAGTLWMSGSTKKRTAYVFAPLTSPWPFIFPITFAYLEIQSDCTITQTLVLLSFLMRRKPTMCGTSSSSYHWTPTMWNTYWVRSLPVCHYGALIEV